MGVFNRDLTEKLAKVLAALGAERALVVAGEDGLDELTTTAPSQASWVANGKVSTDTVDAERLGFARSKVDDLKVDGPEASAEVIREVLAGKKGPHRDIVVLNAAGALMLTAAGATDDWKLAIKSATGSIDSGRAREALEKLVAVSNGGS
jgi:anthranilate phosphoribosyltransferase